VPVSLRRQLTDADVTCPAGTRLGDSCVYCGVEGSVIDGYLNPSSIEKFCAGTHGILDGYQICPSWRAEKHALWDTGKSVDLTPTPIERHITEETLSQIPNFTPEIRERAYSAESVYGEDGENAPVFDPEFGA
jgi:hypothetical protein